MLRYKASPRALLTNSAIISPPPSLRLDSQREGSSGNKKQKHQSPPSAASSSQRHFSLASPACLRAPSCSLGSFHSTALHLLLGALSGAAHTALPMPGARERRGRSGSAPLGGSAGLVLCAARGPHPNPWQVGAPEVRTGTRRRRRRERAGRGQRNRAGRARGPAGRRERKGRLGGTRRTAAPRRHPARGSRAAPADSGRRGGCGSFTLYWRPRGRSPFSSEVRRGGWRRRELPRGARHGPPRLRGRPPSRPGPPLPRPTPPPRRPAAAEAPPRPQARSSSRLLPPPSGSVTLGFTLESPRGPRAAAGRQPRG